jgi:Uma2 family endonuclease
MLETIVKSDYELERGKPVPSKNHGNIQGNIYFLLRLEYYENYNLIPEVNVMINGKVKVPDIAIFKEANYTPGFDEINIEEIPVGVVEILSPKQSMVGLITKSYEYFEAGVKSYWLVLPETKTIYVYSTPNVYDAFFQKGILKDAVLGIELDLGKVFKERKSK